MDRIAGAAQSLLRIVAGLLFFSHGAAKLLGWFGGMPSAAGGHGLPPLIVTAGFIELVGGALILVGFFTRPAAFVCAGEMAVAYFMAHFPRGFWPIQNQGELAVLYCFIFLFLFVAGPGPASADSAIKRRKPAART